MCERALWPRERLVGDSQLLCNKKRKQKEKIQHLIVSRAQDNVFCKLIFFPHQLNLLI